MDICAVSDGIIFQGDTELVMTGLQVSIPYGYEIQVRPRSGLALNHGITVLNSPGTIDSDYRGEIGIMLINMGTEDFEFQAGERIAQLVLAFAPQAEIVIETEELSTTARGSGGFGSTGKS